MTFLRWLLVPVSAALVVAIVIYGGLFAVDIADQNCAADSFAGSSCVASWHTTALETIIYAGVILAAMGLVMVPSLIAPKLKITVSAIGFLLATGPFVVVAILSASLPVPIIVPSDLAAPLIVAIATGGLSLFWVRSRTKRMAEDPS